MKGLMGLMKKVIDQGAFRGFRINEELSIDILQFVDNTVILGDGCSDKLWSVKGILRGFEVMSDLKVNFFKSNFMVLIFVIGL